jgi:hypothetical protein
MWAPKILLNEIINTSHYEWKSSNTKDTDTFGLVDAHDSLSNLSFSMFQCDGRHVLQWINGFKTPQPTQLWMIFFPVLTMQ